MNIQEAIKVARKVKVGGLVHIGEYAISKYGRNNYVIYRAGKLFCSEGLVTKFPVSLEEAVTKIFQLGGGKAEFSRVIVDNE